MRPIIGTTILLLGSIASILFFSSVSVIDTTAVTPTGSPSEHYWIAFVSNRDGDSAIYVMSPDGSNVHRLTSTGLYDNPIWSPDGKRIAFIAYSGTGSQIYVMNNDGTRIVNISHNAEIDGSPSWSPDGTQIVFESLQDEYSRPQLYIMNSDGTNRINISQNYSGDMRDPAWSHDGKHIAFSSQAGGDAIYVMDSDGTNVTRIAEDNMHPAWLPGDSLIASQSTTVGFGIVSIIDISSKQTTKTVDLGGGLQPSWSPDGKRLAVSVQMNNLVIYQIYIVNADGSNPINISNNSFADTIPAWSPVPLALTFFPAEQTPLAPTFTYVPTSTFTPMSPNETEDPMRSTLFAYATMILKTITAQAASTSVPHPTLSMQNIQGSQTAVKGTLFAEATSFFSTATAQAH